MTKQTKRIELNVRNINLSNLQEIVFNNPREFKKVLDRVEGGVVFINNEGDKYLFSEEFVYILTTNNDY